MAVADPVSLSKRYQQQLTQTVDTVRERVNNFKQVAESTVTEYKTQLDAQREQLQPQAQAIVDGYKASVADVETPVAPSAAPFLLRTYLWVGVCLFAFTVARVISGMLLYGLIGAVFDTWVSMLLTYAVLPVFVYMQLRKIQMTEAEREQAILFASLAEGALVGALFSNRYLTIYGPPLFILPISMGLIAHVAGSKESVTGNRRVFLGALVGGAMIGYIAFGILFGSFGFTYIVYTAILAGAAVADLQLKVASIQRGDSGVQLEQWKTFVILITASAVGRFLFSSSKDRAAEIEPVVVPAK